MTDENDMTGARGTDDQRPDARDEPMATSEHGAPLAPDPQAGQLADDEALEPESSRQLRPRTGEPFGP